LRNRQLTEAWLTWLQTAKEQRRIDKVGSKVVAWWHGGVLTRSLLTWRFHASEQLRLERIAHRAIDRMLHQTLWSSFQAWLALFENKSKLENIQLKSVIETLEAKLRSLSETLNGEADNACRERSAELKSLQRFVHGFTSKFRVEIRGVSRALEELVPQSMDRKDQELRSLSLECRRLKQLVKDMVPKERLDDANHNTPKKSQIQERSAMQYDKSARTEHLRCSEELNELKQEVQRQQALVVPKSKLQAADELIANLRFDVDDLQKRMLDMVPKHNHDRCLKDLLTAKSLMMNLRMEASTHLESIQMLVQDMKHLDHDNEVSGTPIGMSGGLSVERVRAISFAVPAAGLAIGQAGRLAPFMMQVIGIFSIRRFA
jgi:hypothetical protein